MPAILPTPINGWRIFGAKSGSADALGLYPQAAPIPAAYDSNLCKPILPTPAKDSG